MNQIRLYLFRNPGTLGTQINNAVQAVNFNNKPANLLTVFDCNTDSLQYCPVSPSDLNVTIFPTLLFLWQVNPNQAVEAYRMTGSVTEAQIRAKLQELATADLSDLWEGLPDGNGSGGQGGPMGFFWGLFNLGINLPWWLWAIVAAGAGAKAVNTRSKALKYTLGAASVIAAGNAWNRKKGQVNGLGAIVNIDKFMIRQIIAKHLNLTPIQITITEISQGTGFDPVVYFKRKDRKGTYTVELTKTGKPAKNTYYLLQDFD